MHDENDSLFKAIDVYARECVFSSIVDYDNDVFGRPDKETQEYYQEMIQMMDKEADIPFVEYTKGKDLIDEIKSSIITAKLRIRWD